MKSTEDALPPEALKVKQLEEELALARAEILTLSKMVLDRHLTDGNDAEHNAHNQRIFEVMLMSLNLTRLPFVMQLGFFRRRHITRLANKLRELELFDRDWYLERFPEVRNSNGDPAHYFITRGSREGHVPCAAFLKEPET